MEPNKMVEPSHQGASGRIRARNALVAGARLAAAGLCVAGVANAQNVLRVNAASTALTPDGTSWAFAYPTLPPALSNALALNTNGNPTDDITAIWVAQGVYLPTSNPTDRTVTFQLVGDVELLGGFDGTETAIGQRAGLFNQTILSGDIDGDPRNQSVDSLHVVTISGSGLFTIDGFQIMFGSATDNSIGNVGGGIFVTNIPDRVIIQRCRLQACRAVFGGGIGVITGEGRVEVSLCNFVACVALSTPLMAPPVLAVFSPLQQVGFGGGLFGIARELYVYNSAFTGNTGLLGGGMFVASGFQTPGSGVIEHQARIVNCLLSNNTADAGGGAFVIDFAPEASGTGVVFDFCTIVDNVAFGTGTPGASLFAGGGGIHVPEGSRTDVRSSILWGNSDLANGSPVIGGTGPPLFGSVPAEVNITYSDVLGLAQLPLAWVGAGAFDQNPLFVNPGMGNFRLSGNSPCVDAADDLVLHILVGAPAFGPGPGTLFRSRSLGDILDVDMNGVTTTEPLPLDLDLVTREVDGPATPATGLDFAVLTRVADMGCYEFPFTLGG